MPLTVTTPPASLPITVADAKLFARVDHDDDDGLIEGLVTAARDHVEQASGRILVETTFLYTARDFDCLIRLPRAPVSAVSYVKYRDTDGDLQTLTVNVDYLADIAAEPATVEPVKSWPAVGDYPDAVQIAFTAGYSDAGEIPARALVAVKALTAHWYDERQPIPDTARVTEMPYHVTRLLNGLRVWR